jgi:hypothetical protein
MINATSVYLHGHIKESMNFGNILELQRVQLAIPGLDLFVNFCHPLSIYQADVFIMVLSNWHLCLSL